MTILADLKNVIDYFDWHDKEYERQECEHNVSIGETDESVV
jgi:hypothetical protein